MGRIPRTFDRFENSDGRPVISLGLVSTGDGEMALESGIGLSGELPVPELRELGDDEAERLFEELIGATEKLAKALRRKAVRKVIDLPGLKELARHFRDNHDFSDFMECHTLRKLLGLPDLLDDLLEEVPESAKPAAEIAALRQAADRLKARQAEEAVVDDIFFVPLVGSKKDVAAVKAALREAVVKVLKEKQLQLAAKYRYSEGESNGMHIVKRDGHDPDTVILAGEEPSAPEGLDEVLEMAAAMTGIDFQARRRRSASPKSERNGAKV